jgi:hypothetical protein
MSRESLNRKYDFKEIWWQQMAPLLQQTAIKAPWLASVL